MHWHESSPGPEYSCVLATDHWRPEGETVENQRSTDGLCSHTENVTGTLREVRHRCLNVIVGDLFCQGVESDR